MNDKLLIDTFYNLEYILFMTNHTLRNDVKIFQVMYASKITNKIKIQNYRDNTNTHAQRNRKMYMKYHKLNCETC